MIALFLAAQVAAADQVVIAFAPPVGQPVIERSVQTRTLPEGPVHYTVVRSYAFTRDEGGWLLEMRTVSADTDAPGRRRDLFLLASKPLEGLALRMRLDASGRVTQVLNGADYWAAFREGQMRLRAGLETREDLSADDRRVIAAVVDAILALPPEGRDARLKGDADALLALAGRTLPADARVPAGDGGELALTGFQDGRAYFTLTSDTDAPLASVGHDERIEVDLATGLAVRRTKTRTIRQGDSSVVTTEERSVTL